MAAFNEFVTALEEIEVENVLVYVGDAVRWDHLCDQVAERGAVLKTVAASTHSPSSFASLATGRHQPNHGVAVFEQRIPSDAFSLFELPDHHTRFANSIFEYAAPDHGDAVDPIYSVLDVEPPAVDHPLDDLPEPFVAMERGPGGHAPYGDFTGTTAEYFHENATAGPAKFQEDYRQSIRMDGDLFLDRLNRIENDGIADNTLVLYTSDHGELLGEGGELGHSSPMRPELAYVPTVFIHPDLPAITIDDAVIHHVDLLPTILDVLGIEFEHVHRLDGVSVRDSVSDEPRPCFYENGMLSDLPFVSGSLQYEGVWDSSGGYVFVRSPLHERLLVAAGKAAVSAQHRYVRNHFPDTLNAYVEGGPVVHGSPSFEQVEAQRRLQRVRENAVDAKTVDLSSAAEKRLNDLGYT